MLQKTLLDAWAPQHMTGIARTWDTLIPSSTTGLRTAREFGQSALVPMEEVVDDSPEPGLLVWDGN